MVGVLILHSCNDDTHSEIEEHETLNTIQLENRDFRTSEESFFFSLEPKMSEVSTRSQVSEFVSDINHELYLLNQQEEFVSQISEQIGDPDWSKTIETTDELLWVPLIKNNEVSGLFGFLIQNETLYFKPYHQGYFTKVANITTTDNIEIPLMIMEYFKEGHFNFKQDEASTRNCPPAPCGLVDVYDGAIVQWVNGVCVCSGNYAPPGCCNGGNTGNELDGGAAEAGGYTIAQWIALVEAWFNRGNNSSTTNTYSGGSSGGPKSKIRVKLIQDLVNEQFIYDWLLDYLDINIGEDGTNMDIAFLLAGNPQIMNPIYLYLNGYYPNVTVNPQHVNSLISLLIDHNLNLGNLEIEHILTFEPELITDIQSFLDNHPNDPLAIQIIHDFIDLQYCDTENPCVHTDYDNRFEEIYDYLIENPNHNFDYIYNNKTSLDNENAINSETWDSTDGPFAQHPIDEFDSNQSPWPSYGPVIPKEDAVVYNSQGYNCHASAKALIAKVNYQISSYFLTYVGENSPNNVIHFETIQIYTEEDGINLAEIDNGLDYLYSALKRSIPVLVGIDIGAGGINNDLTDNTTDHFVVIVGMGTDIKGNYFTFYDNADTEIDKDTHPENKLYFNNNVIEGYSNVDYANGSLFRITQIRKSKPL